MVKVSKKGYNKGMIKDTETRVELDDCPCQECGCIGNGSCGADCVDDEQACTLDSCCVCPCCNKLGKEENMKRWKNDKRKNNEI